MRFDGEEGPYIGEDKVIHLEKFEDGSKSVALRAAFFNISVQGSNVNDGAQQKINSDSMAYLMKEVSTMKEKVAHRTIENLVRNIDDKEMPILLANLGSAGA